MQFTHEVEKDGTIAFLDVSVKRQGNGAFSTSVYRKKTDTNLYVNWRAFAPKQWKIGTLKGLFRRAFLICSEQEGLDKEISHLKRVFTQINGYPKKVVNNTLSQVKNMVERESLLIAHPADAATPVREEESREPIVEEVHPYISLPYKGVNGEKVLKNLKNTIRRCLPKHVIPRFTYNGTKLGSFFRVKDNVKWGHHTDLVYSYVDEEVREEDKNTEYIGQTNVRMETRVYEHCNTDKNSAVYKHLRMHNKEASELDFTILEKRFDKDVDRRIAEAIYTKQKKPFLNRQKKTYKLELFN